MRLGYTHLRTILKGHEAFMLNVSNNKRQNSFWYICPTPTCTPVMLTSTTFCHHGG